MEVNAVVIAGRRRTVRLQHETNKPKDEDEDQDQDENDGALFEQFVLAVQSSSAFGGRRGRRCVSRSW